MKIERISVFRVELPLTHPYRLSGGRLRFERLDSTFVRIDTDNGFVGWGEGCPWGSTYLPAFPGGLRAAIAELAPTVIGLDPRRTDVVDAAMDLALPGHLYAKSALDQACWDVFGKSVGLPVYELLGGGTDEQVTIQSSIGQDTPEAMVADIRRRHEQGYRVHSPKIGSDVDDDVARVEAIAEGLPAGDSVTFDANRAMLPDQAIRLMRRTDDVDAYFEQPCQTYDECLQVRRATTQPIILDEIVVDYADVLRAQRDRACEAIGLKIERVGGLTKARRIRDFCVQSGIRMNIEATGGSVLADSVAVQLAQATPSRAQRATWLCHEMLAVDPCEGGARNLGGHTRAPDRPGLGVEPRLEVLGEPVATYRRR
ncbi:MAG: mandelate racemase/muconate lactonizing enzyme family protein [Acidimicrobiia bacterium]|nr:mandelate racemase/muconate lactonizing enzyme family protein [Acidimicrobiia bacterium]